MTTVEPVRLPQDKSKTLQDQDDAIIWMKFNVLLQGVDELTSEHGHAGDATRQLRVVTAEAIRRNMFGISVREREPTDEQLWTWYAILKQFIEGANTGQWDPVDGTTGPGNQEDQYREVIVELKKRGHEMPAQVVRLEPLDLIGELTKSQ
ncbi:MAG: hypothetical protein KAS19_06830 [Anaerolineales bacterium]|nr:hypothetical protein [Anaerolineales bacterium]